MKKASAVPNDPPEVLELFSSIASLSSKANAFDGVVVRSVAIEYAKQNDFFSGAGAAKTGGRFNPIGLQAVYASLDVVTATTEAYQMILKFGFPMTTIAPRVLAGARVKLQRTLDLTDTGLLDVIGFSLSDLIEEDWRAIQSGGEESWTQAIGRGCSKAGLEAIIVPSSQNEGGRNIVLFPSNLSKASKLQVLRAEQLPK